MHDINDPTDSVHLDLRLNGCLPVSGIVMHSGWQFLPAYLAETLESSLRTLTGDGTRTLGSGLTRHEIGHARQIVLNRQTIEARTSWLCAAFSGVPSFIANGAIELKIGYVIICEITVGSSCYVFLQRLHFDDPFECDLPNPLPRPPLIPFRKIVESIASKSTRFEAIQMKYMTVSKFETRGKTLESFDVSNNLSPAGMSRTIASRVKIADIKESFGATRATVAASSNKISLGLNSLLLGDWENVICELACAIHAHTFIDNILARFAQEKATLAGAVPKSILFDVHAIEALFKRNGAKQLTVDALVDHDAILQSLLTTFQEPYELSPSAPPSTFFSAAGQNFAPEIHVTPRVKTCNVSLPGCGVKFDGVSISAIIQKEKAFRITFSDRSLFYSREGLLGIGDIKESAKILSNIIFGYQAFANAASEKGELAAANTAHAPDSVFGVIDAGFGAAADYLICDDSTDEWCDFLSLEGNGGKPIVTWFHAKMANRKARGPLLNSRSSSGAGPLQVVVAQALKNLGRVRVDATTTEFKDRLKFWGTLYVLPEGNVATTIPRFKTNAPGGTLRIFANVWHAATINPNTVFQSAIVVPEYRKSFLLRLIDRVGSEKGNELDMQVFYLLSAFMGGCFEMGVRPVIYCRA